MEPENRQKSGEAAWHRVPASARSAESHRLANVFSEEIEEDDEDIDFLSTLAAQAARDVKLPPPVQTAKPRRFVVPADENLELFRTTTTERPRPRILSQVNIEHVEMDDLLERLSTTAAALRRKKAA
jgi:hypothetical protein